MSEEQEAQKVKAIEVVPYEWAIWCSVAGSQPFANEIVAQKWSDDGQHIWFMLESHNFLKAAPDDVLDLLPFRSRYDTDERREKRRTEHADFVKKQPTRCHACNQALPTPGQDKEKTGGL